MLRPAHYIGVTVGLAAALIVLALVPRPVAPHDPPAGPVLVDCDGALRELVIQYVRDDPDPSLAVYRQFLPALAADVTVHVVSPAKADYDHLVAAVGATACTLRPVFVGHEMTTWSRDRWLSLGSRGEGPATLLYPRGEDGMEIWPRRAGDAQLARELARALGQGVRARPSALYWDGGDFVVDGDLAFVAGRMVDRNLQITVADRPELLRRLREELGRKVLLLDDAPDHHAGMYVMPLGDGRVMVADPSLGKKALAGRDLPADVLPGGADFGEDLQKRLDAVAAACEQVGRTVLRCPIVPGADGRTWLTYLNAILDQCNGRRIVYMPTFAGADALNAAGTAAWRQAGFEVRPIDCTSSYRFSGSLRCLVNVLRRG